MLTSVVNALFCASNLMDFFVNYVLQYKKRQGKLTINGIGGPQKI